MHYIQTSEGAVSHAIDERNVPGKDYVEPVSSEDNNNVELENDEKDNIQPEKGG